jgi:hypothetical protein
MKPIYRDRSFCVLDDCIKRNECDKYFSEKHKKRAIELDMDVSLFKETECYKPEKKQ